jgi:hypothetical protein
MDVRTHKIEGKLSQYPIATSTRYRPPVVTTLRAQVSRRITVRLKTKVTTRGSLFVKNVANPTTNVATCKANAATRYETGKE